MVSVTTQNLSYEGDCTDYPESRCYRQRYYASLILVIYSSLEHSLNIESVFDMKVLHMNVLHMKLREK